MKKSAEELFLKGYNCAQSVFAAYAGEFGLDPELSLKISASMGGGVGRMREVCGAFSACAMLCGMKFADDSPDPEKKAQIYERVQKLAEEFKARNGSIICAKILDLKKDSPISHRPDPRNPSYYASRPCLKVVKEAALIVEKYILNDKSEKS